MKKVAIYIKRLFVTPSLWRSSRVMIKQLNKMLKSNNILTGFIETSGPMHYAKKDAFIFKIGLPAKASL